ncbi:hypothetical protein SUGI_0899960 [Cryptomeria japonica]|uniref:uncharacterized protein LOC131062779 n=1 Tax=Cryptomeria japonica TaxID=3369 RepID=UPI002414A091|nr:uncharacterized protein LOC131062779 [Cryptomeria japonica]GLJ43329.1 hypothetical protein SUGI_0899960 [Cryptomeria japonica]
MSTDRISVVQLPKKRKMAQAQEDVGFPPALKPIVTERPACKPKLLLLGRQDSTESCRDDSEGESDISYVENCDGILEGSEEYMTPKSVEHQIPEILPCPPAPRKPRATASIKPLDFFHVSPCELNLLFNLSWPKRFSGQGKGLQSL